MKNMIKSLIKSNRVFYTWTRVDNVMNIVKHQLDLFFLMRFKTKCDPWSFIIIYTLYIVIISFFVTLVDLLLNNDRLSMLLLMFVKKKFISLRIGSFDQVRSISSRSINDDDIFHVSNIWQLKCSLDRFYNFAPYNLNESHDVFH